MADRTLTGEEASFPSTLKLILLCPFTPPIHFFPLPKGGHLVRTFAEGSVKVTALAAQGSLIQSAMSSA